YHGSGMAPAGYTIDIPAGNPEELRAAVARLRQLANDIDGRGLSIAGALSGKSVPKDAMIVGSRITETGYGVRDGAEALAAFATPLEKAQSAIRDLDQRSDDAYEEAYTAVVSDPVHHGLSDADRDRLVEKLVADKMAVILAAVDRHRADLDAASASCSKRLGMAIPGYTF